MALRSSGDDYEHSAIQPLERVVATGPRAPFRGQWVERLKEQPASRLSAATTYIERELYIDIVADAVYGAQPMQPSAALAIAEAVLEKLNGHGYVISRA